MLPVKILLLIVGLVDATGFVGLCFWKGEPFTYFVIIAVTAGMGFTGGVFESIIPSKYPITLTSNNPVQNFQLIYFSIVCSSI